MPFVPVGVGGPQPRQVRNSESNTTLLFSWVTTADPSASLGMALPLSGRPPLKPLLP